MLRGDSHHRGPSWVVTRLPPSPNKSSMADSRAVLNFVTCFYLRNHTGWRYLLRIWYKDATWPCRDVQVTKNRTGS